MRVIAGAFKGRKLESPADQQVRPTTDKVKEAMFSMLPGDLPGAVCADFFAGSGTLGACALKSERSCILCDSSREAVDIILERLGTDAEEV